ncbi:MAG: hypothetical protein AB8B72_07420 [Crocinitomicaceae bacterium]
MKYFFTLAILSLLFTSCKKEGCTDSLAINHDKEAEKDDNSCMYDASVIFWINAAGSTNFDNSWIDKLKIYIDDVKIGEMTTNSSQLDVPECNTVGITYFSELGSNSTKSINYKITYDAFGPPGEDNETTYSEGSLQMKGGFCTPFLIQ